MHFIKKSLKFSLYFLVGIAVYLLFAVVLSYITVNKKQQASDKSVYLSSNGIHLSLIIPKNELNDAVLKDLNLPYSCKFVRFGWGDVNFYLNTPTWNDFKFSYAFGALFLDNPTLVEVNAKNILNPDWTRVPIRTEQLEKLNIYIQKTFKLDHSNHKVTIEQKMYPNSQLYQANGSYSPVKTCNTWVNTGFKRSGLKASFWTLFDFGLLNKYQ
ncbi:DUF2459 domain-containing protein [Tenacibaculum sp. 190524A05c]|uniref:DUF2459 domain-containing protein n=1 Tax=Tenacibaculum platacis TaxID=3137852 RepID=A0ABM9NQW9_9FLAO